MSGVRANLRLCGSLSLMLMAAACSPGTAPQAPIAEGSAATAQAAPPPVEADLVVGPAFTDVTLRGTVHGVTPLAEHATDCPGVTSPLARHVVDVQQQTGLTLTAHPIGTGMMDLAVALVGPNGTTICADDGTTLDPWWSGIL
jgi:hypothetical protein